MILFSPPDEDIDELSREVDDDVWYFQDAVEGLTVCKSCGCQGLKWVNTIHGRRPVYGDHHQLAGKIHACQSEIPNDM